MSTFVPSWALAAAAIDATGDPTLRPGVHLRVLPGKRLGLPVAPLLVQRVHVGHPARHSKRVDVVWTGAQGEHLTAPFDLGPASPATAWLPSEPGNPVLYAEVLVKEHKPVRDDYDRWRKALGEPGRRTTVVEGRGAAGRWRREPRPWPVPRPRPLPRAGVRVDAVVSGTLGPAVVASATRAPYQVCATGMDRVVVTGAGQVVGLRVLRARDVVDGDVREPWRLLDLPVERAARYQGLEDAWARAEDRVLRGAPQRQGLHDEPDASHAAACAAVSDADDLHRVSVLWSERLERMLRSVVDDLGSAPASLLLPREALHGTSVATATLAVPPLAGVLQGALDPGCGRLLGLVEHDEEPPGDEGELVVYLVRGGWTLHPAAESERSGIDLSADSAEDVHAALLLLSAAGDPADFPLPLPELVAEQREGPFLDCWTAAAVVLGAPAAPVAPPSVGAALDLGWQTEPVPSARRHVALPLSGLVPAAAVALARETPGVVGLNPRLPDVLGDPGVPDRAVAIVPGVLAGTTGLAAASSPGQGEVHDRRAPETATDYRVAQADWFGRWSAWTHATAGPGTRPPVPVPVLEVAYVDPTAPGGSGTLQVRALQPRDPDLPPAAFPLAALVVTASVGGAPTTGTAAAQRGPAPAGTDDVPLLVAFPVPPLAPSERRELTATAHWTDSAGRSSAESPRSAVVAVDPRAPARLELSPELQYAARPDALGRARVRLTWTATAGTAYRVYASDETTLRQRLTTLGGAGAAVLEALASATTAPQRAEVFRVNAGLFDRSCFELRTTSPLLATAGGTTTHEYEVSGSTGVLLFFKVLPVAVLRTSPVLELGGETSFASSVLLVRGVPNSPAPPTPALTASAHPSDPAQVRLTVSVPAGQTAPAALRLRRSRVSGADPLAMPVVATAAPTAWPAVVDDDGRTPWDAALRLAPWSTYTWRVEVQGGPEPGSTLPGAWSQASAPASWTVVPAAPAAADPAGTATMGGGVVRVAFTHPDALDAGPQQPYVLDVYRLLPSGATPAPGDAASGAVGSFPAPGKRQPDGSYVVEDTAPGVPSGTRYLVEVCDPIGRRSPRAVVATVP